MLMREYVIQWRFGRPELDAQTLPTSTELVVSSMVWQNLLVLSSPPFFKPQPFSHQTPYHTARGLIGIRANYQHHMPKLRATIEKMV